MEITKELLKQKFVEYNKLYFNNELKMCRFTYTYMRDVFGRYMTHTTPKGEIVGHIWISKSIDLNEEMLKELLVHEMIHHYVRTIDGVFFDGFFCHGRTSALLMVCFSTDSSVTVGILSAKSSVSRNNTVWTYGYAAPTGFSETRSATSLSLARSSRS